jgi:mannose/cellobiose epimerase-like protein (N-acyl-D-glucosamine 2-epimerase family)
VSPTQRLFGFVWQGQAMAIDFSAVHAAFRSSSLQAGPPKSAALGMLMREGTPTMVMPHDQLLETLDGSAVSVQSQPEPALDASMWVVVLSEQTTPVRLAFRAEETHGPFRATLIRGEHGVMAEYSDRQWQVLRAKAGVA